MQKKEYTQEEIDNIFADLHTNTSIWKKTQHQWDTSHRQKGIVQSQLYTKEALEKRLKTLAETRPLKGRKCEWGAKISQTKKTNEKKILQPKKRKSIISCKDGIETIHESITQAAIDLKMKATGINHCLAGLQKISNGYSFRYA